MKKGQRSEYLIVFLVIGVLFVGSVLLTNFFFKNELIAQQEEYLQKKSDLLSKQLTPATFSKEKLTSQQNKLLQQLASEENERITLMTPTGQIFYDSSNEQLKESRKNRPEVEAVLSGADYGSAIRKSTTLNKELLYYAEPVEAAGSIAGIIRISEATSQFSDSIRAFQRYIILTLGVLFLLITFFILLLLRQKNEPLVTVLPILKRMLKHPDESRSIIQHSSEWNELYQTVNALSQQVSQTYKAYTSTDEQFHQLLDELMIGIFIIDTQGALRLVNPKMLEILGLSQQAVNRNYLEVIHDPTLIHLIHQASAEKMNIHEEIQVTQVPQKMCLDVSLRYLDDPINEYQVLGIAYDLTRVRQLEAMQKDFVSNVSHELKTPVTSLLGFTETLLDGAKDDPVTLEHFLTIMQKDAQRLQQMIQDILQLSRSSSTIDFEEQQIQLAPFIEEVLSSYRKTIQEKQLKVVIAGSSTCTFYTKPELFYPIIKNLVENAIQYSPPQGTITISYAIDQQLTLSVADTGIGISQKDQERIFERFYRVDKARSRHSGGTGLGLSIVQNYTELLGGTVAIESHLGLGSTFTVSLPLKPKDMLEDA
jgi:two-component system phosphate regulon sensor histidine kinase PhoR